MPTVEELTEKIAALEQQLKRTKAQTDDDDPGVGRSIPYARFAQTRQQLAAAEETLEGIKIQLGKTATELKAGHDAEVAKIRKEFETERVSLSRRSDVDLSLSDLGIKDPAIRRLLREHHEALPEADKKAHADPAAWLKARRSAAEASTKEKGKTPPEPVGWLDPYEASIQVQPVQPRRGAPPPLNVDAGPKGQQGFGSDASVDDLVRAAGWGQKKDA